MATQSIFVLSDGRALEILDNQVASPNAVIFHHGTPASCTTWQEWIDLLAEFNIRAISYCRAGYGRSARNPGRTVFDNNKDIAELLQANNIQKFVAIGWSGGGPHCLANTCDPRNVGAISLAGVAAYGVDDLDFLAGMGPENEDEFGAALKGEEALRAWMLQNGAAFQHVTGPQVREAFGGLIGAADKAVLEGDFAELSAVVARHALLNGFDGWIDDDIAFIKPWGFDLAAIAKPVFLWQGDQDFMVPHAHGHWLKSKIAGATLVFVPGHGHLSLFKECRDNILLQARKLLEQ